MKKSFHEENLNLNNKYNLYNEKNHINNTPKNMNANLPNQMPSTPLGNSIPRQVQNANKDININISKANANNNQQIENKTAAFNSQHKENKSLNATVVDESNRTVSTVRRKIYLFYLGA